MDYNQIKRLFPRKLANHETFSVFVEIASTELNKIFDTIALMTTLSNVDRCPEEFISHLGDLVDFDWSSYLESDVQRECMKLKWETHKYKGTKEDLEYMATYGDIDGYQGGRLFVPGCDADLKAHRLLDLIYDETNEDYQINYTSYDEPLEELEISQSAYNISYKEINPDITYSTKENIYALFNESIWGSNNMLLNDGEEEIVLEEYTENYEMMIEEKYKKKPRAVVTLASEHLFTFNNSTFDGEHYIPDNVAYKDGVILIEVTRLNQTIMDKVETVKPVGMLAVYKYIHDNTCEYITHTRTISEVNL